MRKLILISLCLGLLTTSWAQNFANKEVGKKQEVLIDSLKTTEWPHMLPIWGEKVTNLGFTLQLPAGVSAMYLWQKSDLVIENLQVGFNNGPMYSLDEVIRFNSATSEAEGFNVRPDLWLFPFLNVYGILSKSKPVTSVDFSLYVPDSDGNWSSVAQASAVAEFDATTMGFGLTPTIGVAGGFFALDMNFTWSDVSNLDEPAFAFVLGPRFGKSFKFKNPNRNITFWVGGFRLKLNSSTSGSIAISDLIDDPAGLQDQVDQGIENVSERQMAVDDWWNGLSEAEQNNPINEARYETANRALDRAGEVLSTIDAALNDENSATVQYSLDKRPKDPWNFVVGTQYQLNRHLQARFEYGFLGSRSQIITGVQYRFGF